MKEPTNRDILTAVEGLTRDVHLFRDVTESRFGLMGERFDRVDLQLAQHSSALTELAADMTVVKATLAEHDRKFDRIETTLAEHDRKFDRIDTTLAEHGRLLVDQRRRRRS